MASETWIWPNSNLLSATTAMWSPKDEHSIPTPQERFRATEALDLLQVEIVQSLAKADELELELKELEPKWSS